jgi:hypothetical protein
LATGSPAKAGRSNRRQQNDRSSGNPRDPARSKLQDHAGQHQRTVSAGALPPGTTVMSSSNSASPGTSQGADGLDSRLASFTNSGPPCIAITDITARFKHHPQYPKLEPKYGYAKYNSDRACKRADPEFPWDNPPTNRVQLASLIS